MAVCPHYCTDPDVTWGRGRGCPVPPSCALLGGFAIDARVALLWQHNANPSLRGVFAHCWLVTGGWRGRSQNCAPHIVSGRGWLAGDWPSTGGILNTTAAACTAGFQWWRSGDITRTQNVSEYMLVLTICLVPLVDKHVGWQVKLRDPSLTPAIPKRLRHEQ